MERMNDCTKHASVSRHGDLEHGVLKPALGDTDIQTDGKETSLKLESNDPPYGSPKG